MKQSRLLQAIGRRLEQARLRNPDRPGRRLLVHWADLLEEVHIRDAEEFNEEVDALRTAEKNGLISISWSRRNRDEPDKIRIPFESEETIFELLDTREPKELLAQTKSHFAAAQQWPGQRWQEWCRERVQLLEEAKPIAPLRWRRPETIPPLLDALYNLDRTQWEQNTYIRAASVAIGFDSKRLGALRTTMETLLSHLRGQETTLDMLGIAETPRTILVAGPLQLEMSEQLLTPGHSAGAYGVISEQVHLAKRIRTTAKRAITVENHTTFHQLAAADPSRQTLILQSSYPTREIVALLQKLPPELPLYHFGDTDPAGFEILHQLRVETGRRIEPFLMQYFPGAKTLTATDREILNRMLLEGELDIQMSLQAIAQAGTKGNHEQEQLGKPTIPEWPFYEAGLKSANEAAIKLNNLQAESSSQTQGTIQNLNVGHE